MLRRLWRAAAGAVAGRSVCAARQAAVCEARRQVLPALGRLGQQGAKARVARRRRAARARDRLVWRIAIERDGGARRVGPRARLAVRVLHETGAQVAARRAERQSRSRALVGRRARRARAVGILGAIRGPRHAASRVRAAAARDAPRRRCSVGAAGRRGAERRGRRRRPRARVVEWWEDSPPSRAESVDVVVPSGTGTTALFLARHLAARAEMRVWAVPCVGDGAYLRAIKCARSTSRREATARAAALAHVAALDEAALRRARARRWRCGSSAAARTCPSICCTRRRHPRGPRAGDAGLGGRAREAERATVYLHTGGLEGVESQLDRYRRAGMLDAARRERYRSARAGARARAVNERAAP